MKVASFGDRLTYNLWHGVYTNAVAVDVREPLRKAFSRIQAATTLSDLYFPRKERVFEIIEGSALRYGFWFHHGYRLSFEIVGGNVEKLRFEDCR